MISGDEYKLWSSSLCNFLHSPVTSSLLGPIFSLGPCSQTPCLCCSLNARDQVSHPYKHTTNWMKKLQQDFEIRERYMTDTVQRLCQREIWPTNSITCRAHFSNHTLSYCYIYIYVHTFHIILHMTCPLKYNTENQQATMQTTITVHISQPSTVRIHFCIS
jgi:hypothetical protein